MYDNKIRLSQDVLEKAELIAQEWGLKNARAAVEAVFRKYADEYLSRHAGRTNERSLVEPLIDIMPVPQPKSKPPTCDALNELDELLGL
ncbi:MAG: hypothetical protein NW224_18160 [Leptolyngbyaceae cyanobacterium bins.302]|nr:hypothetical protein [Leptolyngbyaceae cyanobacterium bins.302]